MRRTLFILAVLCLLTALLTAQADAFTIVTPGFAVSVPLYAAVPPPVYVAPPPPPVYVAPAYAPPVVVAPAYPGPVYVGPGYPLPPPPPRW